MKFKIDADFKLSQEQKDEALTLVISTPIILIPMFAFLLYGVLPALDLFLFADKSISEALINDGVERGFTKTDVGLLVLGIAGLCLVGLYFVLMSIFWIAEWFTNKICKTFGLPLTRDLGKKLLKENEDESD